MISQTASISWNRQHTQYEKTTLLKRKEQRQSYKTEKLERGKGESQSQYVILLLVCIPTTCWLHVSNRLKESMDYG